MSVIGVIDNYAAVPITEFVDSTNWGLLRHEWGVDIPYADPSTASLDGPVTAYGPITFSTRSAVGFVGVSGLEFWQRCLIVLMRGNQ